MSSAPDSAALGRLEATVKLAQALCDQLSSTLLRIHENPTAAPDESTSKIDPIALSRDAVTLVRAHSTKLSLLLINEPFTPSAIIDVLKQLLSGPVLGVASATQACDSTQYTACFRKELAWRSSRVLMNLKELIGKIPKDGKILSGDKRAGCATEDKGSLPSTGILWSSCDAVLALVNMGVSGFLVKKVGEWKDTMKDVMEELKEWGDEEPDDEDDDDDDDDEDDDTATDANENNTNNATTSAQDMIDDFMNSSQAIPRDDPKSIRPRLESTLRRIRLVILLYQAIIKRRLKNLPPLPPPSPPATSSSSDKITIPQRLDEIAQLLWGLPEKFSDLATYFYEMETGIIDKVADDCFLRAFTIGELMSPSWDGEQDEFSEWTEKFKAEIRKS